MKESISQNVIDQSEKLNSPYSSQSNISFPTNNTKSGWLTKKGKPRWFLILNDTLVWYDREQVIDLKQSFSYS